LGKRPQKAGYATDPMYPDKLISLIERFDLTRFDIKKIKKLDRIQKKKPNLPPKQYTLLKKETPFIQFQKSILFL